MKRVYKFSIISPAGNNTALVKGIVKDFQIKKRLNDIIMKKFPNVEQVGFYDFVKKKNLGKLEMAGGEFCGNALRSIAYLLLKGNKGGVRFNVFGVNQMLCAGIKRNKTAYAQIPIKKNLKSVSEIEPNLYLVKIEGITHLIKKTPQKLSVKSAKFKAKKLLQKTGLLNSIPASGVMFIRSPNSNRKYEIQPIVWVRDIKTFFYETACASGTAAVGMWSVSKKKEKQITLSVKQPSGKYLQTTVTKNNQEFQETYIDGPIKILKKGLVISI